jgi:2,3,4,5-tetrahydropyridine-2-carboxylate N-succinyltransferase
MSMNESLEQSIESFFALGSAAMGNRDALSAFHQLRAQLEDGTLRSAEPDASHPTGWRVNAWVKRGILLGFRLGTLEKMNGSNPVARPSLSFVDKGTYPIRRFEAEDGIRIVPGGSCAQIGKRVHLSAAAQIGGVLEPVNASPVIIEDDALIGGNTGVYEGTIVRSRAVLAAGVILTRGTPVYDLPNNTILKATPELPLIIPSGAVVVAGSRAIQTEPGKSLGLSVYTPIIVKYRDEKTDLSTTLEDLLR